MKNNHRSSVIPAEKSRCECFGEYLIDHGATVRDAAGYFGMSKSTVHKDVATRLRYVNPVLFREVNRLLQQNKAERHLRGGEATRKRYASGELTPSKTRKDSTLK